MSDKDMVYRLRINPKPAHFFGKAVVVISRIDHNGRIAFAVEEDVGHPLPDAGHVLIHPAGIQGLEDLLAPVHPAHFLLLKLCRLLAHPRSLFPFPPPSPVRRLVSANYRANAEPHRGRIFDQFRLFGHIIAQTAPDCKSPPAFSGGSAQTAPERVQPCVQFRPPRRARQAAARDLRRRKAPAKARKSKPPGNRNGSSGVALVDPGGPNKNLWCFACG